MENLIGVVLCGGRSKRMGTDKGLLIKDKKPWAQVVAKKLENNGLPVIISINKTQQETYSQVFPDSPLFVDYLPIEGPLNGLLSIHRSFPDKDILLMACDLIDMHDITIQNLTAAYISNPNFEYYTHKQNGFTQTFCAIYTYKALIQVYKRFTENELENFSLRQLFQSGNTLYLPTDNDESFKNYNNL